MGALHVHITGGDATAAAHEGGHAFLARGTGELGSFTSSQLVLDAGCDAIIVLAQGSIRIALLALRLDPSVKISIILVKQRLVILGHGAVYVVNRHAALDGAHAHAAGHSVALHMLVLGAQSLLGFNSHGASCLHSVAVANISIGLTVNGRHVHRSAYRTHARANADDSARQLVDIMGSFHCKAAASDAHARVGEGLGGDGQIIHIHRTGEARIKATATL